MAAPKVRKFNTLVAQIGKSVQPQKALIDADIRTNDQMGAAQIAGLEATKQQNFEGIAQGVQDAGMRFSGQGADAQMKYLGATYLPALANLQATIAQTRSSLMGKKADLDTNVFNKAFDVRENDINRRFSFTERVAGQKFTSGQNKADRKFQARQAALERDFRASESQKDRNAAAANAARANQSNPADVFDADRRAVASELGKVAGNDGYVSPGSYATMKNNWISSGYSGKTFDKYFKSYRNPQNPHYKLSKKK